MRIFEPDDRGIRDFWRKYPVRLPGHSIADCHHRETILVRSKEGGFVTRNCPQCGSHETLPESVFLQGLELWVACPECQQRTTPEVLPDKNYGFVCARCDLAVRLCDLLPYWSDLPQMRADQPAVPRAPTLQSGTVEATPPEPPTIAPAVGIRLSPPARAIAQVLLEHHRAHCRGRLRRPPLMQVVITYGELCRRADTEDFTRTVGRFLGEVAEWCQQQGWPPLNSLAVNQDTRMPGEGYDTAAGCSVLRWPETAQACIEFDGYPDRVD